MRIPNRRNRRRNIYVHRVYNIFHPSTDYGSKTEIVGATRIAENQGAPL